MPSPKKSAAKKAAVPHQAPRTRKERKFPALTFPEAVKLADGIQTFASGQKVRRLVLFESLKEEPDSLGSRKLITASGQYGLTKGGYQAEFLELTEEGNEATNEEAPVGKKIQARFNLAIKKHVPF